MTVLIRTSERCAETSDAHERRLKGACQAFQHYTFLIFYCLSATVLVCFSCSNPCIKENIAIVRKSRAEITAMCRVEARIERWTPRLHSAMEVRVSRTKAGKI